MPLPFVQVTADPTGVDMDRVASTMRAIEDVEAGRLAPDAANEGNQRDFAGAAGSDMGFSRCGSGRRRGALGHLWCEPFLPMVLIFVSAGASAVLAPRESARLS